MKASEVRELTTKEIKERIVTEKDALLKLKLSHSISPLDNPVKIRFVKKDIARLKTELKRRELNKEEDK